MAAHLLEFLKNKYIDEFKAAQAGSSWSNVPCPELLKKISNQLETKPFKHDKTHEAIDLLYDLNNLLEDFTMSEVTTPGGDGRKSRCSWRGIRRGCDATKNKLCYARNTQAEVDKLIERLTAMQLQSTEESRSDREEVETSSISVIKHEGFPYFDKSEVCCFDSPLKYFKDFILLGNNHNMAMAFVGHGGSGKSTMARMIFLDEEVQKHFDNVVLWVDCSEVSDPDTKLSCITVEKFRHTASPCRYTLEEALRSLHGVIRDRRCLVVLDGLWISSGTKNFVEAVTGQLRGTIIITTRLDDVAESLVTRRNTFHSGRFLSLPSEGENKEEGSMDENVGARPTDWEMQTQSCCWLIFEETLKRKKFGDNGGIELHKDIRIAELEDVIKRSSWGIPLAAKTLAEVISQRLYKTGYWAEEEPENTNKRNDEQPDNNSNNKKRDETWEFRLKVDVYDHLSLSKAWYRVLSTKGVVEEKSYYHKNEFIVTSKCHPRDVFRSLRDVCHLEFISMSRTRIEPGH